MRIVVNTRLLIKNKLDGIGWFTFETMSRIVQGHPEVDFYFIFDRKPHPDYIFGKNVTPIVLHPQARHPLLYILFFEFSLPKMLSKIKPDLFVSCDGYMSLRSEVPTLNVMHDLNFEEYPEHLPGLLSKYYRFFFPKFAKKAKRLATVSQYSKSDISKRYDVQLSKIDVVYNGVNETFKPLNKAEIDQVKKQYSQGSPYFLFVGSIHPRKNLLNQLRAFYEFRESTDKDFKFLIVGSDFYRAGKVKKAISNSKYFSDVIFLGRQNSKDLKNLFGGAFALTYVSFYEGFGIPLIEAMRSGVPVITSSSSSMPEIGGDAVLICNPGSPHDIAIQMIRLSNDDELRSDLIDKGLEHSKKFSWDKTAEALWASIKKSLGCKNGVDTRSEGAG